MRRRKSTGVIEKPYLVGIPIPYLDRNGRKLKAPATKKWTQMAKKELTECFGAATPVAAPSLFKDRVGKILNEKGQTLVLSACSDRDEFLAKRDRISAFVERMGRALDQQSVFVLTVVSDSFLIEFEA